MKQLGLFYDRRKGYYKDKGRPARSIVSVMELTKAVIAIVVQRPDDARGRAGNYLKKEPLYEEVFGKWTQEAGWVDVMPLPAYVTCVRVVRNVQQFLREAAKERSELHGHEHNLRFHVAMATTCLVLGSGTPDAEQLAALKVSSITKDILQECTDSVWSLYKELGATDNVAKGPDLKDKLLTQIRQRYNEVVVP